MNNYPQGPSKPGEGLTWKVGAYVYIHRPASRHGPSQTILGEFTKVGRKWAEVENITETGQRHFQRFSMLTAREDSSWQAATLWVGPDAIARADRRREIETEIQTWARHVRADQLPTEALHDLHGFLVGLGEIV
jgi:hypothetical protein